jgi:hypothetical protein
MSSSSPSLLALQPCVGLGLVRGYVTVDFSGVGSLAPHPTPNLRTRDYTFSGPYPSTCLVWVAPEPFVPASIPLRVTGARKPPLHDKAVVLEEDVSSYHLLLSGHVSNTDGQHAALYY